MEIEELFMWLGIFALGAGLGLGMIWVVNWFRSFRTTGNSRPALFPRKSGQRAKTPRTVSADSAKRAKLSAGHHKDAAGASPGLELKPTKPPELKDFLRKQDFSGADKFADALEGAEARFRAYLRISKDAAYAKDRHTLIYAEAAEVALDSLPEEQDAELDAASRGTLLRYNAADSLAALYCEIDRPDFAARALGRSSYFSLTLHQMRSLLRKYPDAPGLPSEISAVLRRTRARLDRGEDPLADAPEWEQNKDKLVAAMAKTWAALGDHETARAEIEALPPGEMRDEIEAKLDGRETHHPPKTAAHNQVEQSSPQEPEKRRYVDVAEIVECIAAGDLAGAATLAGLHNNSHTRDRYLRDVARASADTGELSTARDFARLIENTDVRTAALKELDRVAAGGAPVPPAGTLVAVIVDNNQPGNPEKQHYVKWFSSEAQLLEWAERRIRASLERYRSPGKSPAGVEADWRHGGDGVRVNYRAVHDDKIAKWAATPPTADEIDHEALTPRLF